MSRHVRIVWGPLTPMSCSANVLTLQSPADRARFVAQNLPPHLFRSVAGPDQPDPAQTAWRISPEPFPLKPQTVAAFESLGTDLLKFYRAANKLYYQSVRRTAPAFISEYLEFGKPEHIIRLQRQNRFKNELPGVIRPDVILTDDGFIASELESVPGGLGFVGAMGDTYCKLGYDQIGEFDGIQRGFARMASSVSGGKQKPVIAIAISRESNDYRGEMDWLAAAINATGQAEAVTVSPEEIVFTEE